MHDINEAVSQHVWKPVVLCKRGPPILHLSFADNLILFVEASLSQVDFIKRVLDSFCANSGKKVNKEKSRIFFSRNVPTSFKRILSTKLKVTKTEDLEKYLGFSLFHS